MSCLPPLTPRSTNIFLFLLFLPLFTTTPSRPTDAPSSTRWQCSCGSVQFSCSTRPAKIPKAYMRCDHVTCCTTTSAVRRRARCPVMPHRPSCVSTWRSRSVVPFDYDVTLSWRRVGDRALPRPAAFADHQDPLRRCPNASARSTPVSNGPTCVTASLPLRHVLLPRPLSRHVPVARPPRHRVPGQAVSAGMSIYRNLQE